MGRKLARSRNNYKLRRSPAGWLVDVRAGWPAGWLAVWRAGGAIRASWAASARTPLAARTPSERRQESMEQTGLAGGRAFIRRRARTSGPQISTDKQATRERQMSAALAPPNSRPKSSLIAATTSAARYSARLGPARSHARHSVWFLAQQSGAAAAAAAAATFERQSKEQARPDSLLILAPQLSHKLLVYERPLKLECKLCAPAARVARRRKWRAPAEAKSRKSARRERRLTVCSVAARPTGSRTGSCANKAPPLASIRHNSGHEFGFSTLTCARPDN